MGSKRFDGILFTAKAGDHDPIHFHAFIGSGRIIVTIRDGRVFIVDRDDAERGVTRSEIRRVLRIANREVAALLALWKGSR